MRNTIAGLTASAAIVAVVAGVVHSTAVALIIPMGLALVVIAVRPTWSIYLTLILSTLALPTFLPTTFEVGGSTLHAYEPFLLVALIYMVHTQKTTTRGKLFPSLFAAFIVVGISISFATGRDHSKIIYDVRPLLEVAASAVIATRLYGARDGQMLRRCLQCLTWSLWVSAAVTLAGAVLGVSVSGRTEDASLISTDAATDAATRLITEATFPALATLCAVITLAVGGKASLRSSWRLSVPALLIVTLSFSRNSILAVTVAVLFGWIATRTLSSTFKAAATAGTAVAVFAILVALNPVLAHLPGGTFVNTQVSSYTDRVVEGLTSGAQSTDASIQFRADEDAYLLQGIASSPIVGHGFGYAYKPSGGTASFYQDYAPYFAHNLYLWVCVKTGFLGGLLFLASVLGPLIGALRRPTAVTLALAGSFASLLAVCTVAPVALGETACVLFGGVFGLLCVASQAEATAQEAQKTPAQRRRARTPLRARTVHATSHSVSGEAAQHIEPTGAQVSPWYRTGRNLL